MCTCQVLEQKPVTLIVSIQAINDGQEGWMLIQALQLLSKGNEDVQEELYSPSTIMCYNRNHD